jgi:fatty-acid peroxygenase
MPRDPQLDSTLALLADPYRWLGRTALRLGTDSFEARLLGERTLCLTGEAGARLFYDDDLMSRAGAAPLPIRTVLFGMNPIHGLDGAAHRHRKRLYLDLLAPHRADAWEAALRLAGDGMLPGLSARGATVREAALLTLTQAACDWAGLPVGDDALEDRARMFDRMVRLAGEAGPSFALGLRARLRADRWAKDLVERARGGDAPDGSPLAAVASWRDPDGNLLPASVAGEDLLNMTRPAVAVCSFVEHMAHALHAHPEHRARVAGEPAFRRAFVHEVRRLYPFVPLLPARARRGFDWRGTSVAAGTRVLIDIYGIARDPSNWPHPDAFRPERFLDREIGPFEMMPQGGGDHAAGHRCPGEWATIRLMEVWGEWLATRLDWRATGDPTLDMGAFLAPPRDPFALVG